jgi:hypothetical protein
MASSNVTLVVQGYDPRRVPSLCKQLAVHYGSTRVVALLLLWNNQRTTWPGCPDRLLPPFREGDAWRRAGEGGKLLPRLIFAAEDRLDNAYAIPGTLDPMPTEAIVVMNDDARAPAAAIECMADTWAASDGRLVVAPELSARTFHPTRLGRYIFTPHVPIFCAFLPIVVLVPLSLLRAYAQHAHLREFVRASVVCDDFALAALAGRLARRSAAPNPPEMPLAALQGVRVSHEQGLALDKQHFIRRLQCPHGARAALQQDEAARRTHDHGLHDRASRAGESETDEGPYVASTLRVSCTDNAPFGDRLAAARLRANAALMELKRKGTRQSELCSVLPARVKLQHHASAKNTTARKALNGLNRTP